MQLLTLALAGLTAVLSVTSAAPNNRRSSRPNIVLIITDDQDLQINSLQYMPKVKQYLTSQGTSYAHHFCTVALCCPSRVSLLTGKTAHNHNVTDVVTPYGGYPKFVSQGLNSDYLPLWLQSAGYSTYYAGKLFNGHNFDNYNKPYAAGWDHNEFLLEPYTYQYVSPAFQKDKQPPVIFNQPGDYSTTLLNQRTLDFIDNAAGGGKPFFLGVAPIAPHANLKTRFSAPIPEQKYQDLFPGVIVPRYGNFNPDQPSGASWVKTLPKLNQTNVDYIDEYYRKRLRALQSVDDLVEDIVQKLNDQGVLDNTFIIYTSDNGYHLGHHRMQPGKVCGYQEDVHIPFIVRGPGVPRNASADVVTNHIDFAPTILKIAGAPARAEFDGTPIPLTATDIRTASGSDGSARREHSAIEFWGSGLEEGDFAGPAHAGNTYKALRIVGHGYNLYYSVWCTNEHELYDIIADPGQMYNLYGQEGTLLNRPREEVVRRLDSLLFVLKTCQGDVCVHPWNYLQPNSGVDSLESALDAKHDTFYANAASEARVTYSACKLGYLEGFEGATFRGPGSLSRRKDGTTQEEWA